MSIREGLDREVLAGLHRVILTFKDERDSEPIDAYLTSSEINKMLNQILIHLKVEIEKSLLPNEELNKEWAKSQTQIGSRLSYIAQAQIRAILNRL